MADINLTSPVAIGVYCLLGLGIVVGLYKKNKGSDTTTRDSFDAVDNTGVDNFGNTTSGGKISRRNKSKKNNKTRNKKYKRS
jgi:hypothetical protein